MLEPVEGSQGDPLVAAGAEGGGRSGGVGDGLIGAAEPQELKEFVEDDPVVDAWAVTAQGVVGVIARRVGQ